MMTFNVLSLCTLYNVHGFNSLLHFIKCSYKFGLFTNISGKQSQSFKVVKFTIIFKTCMSELKSLFVLIIKHKNCRF